MKLKETQRFSQPEILFCLTPDQNRTGIILGASDARLYRFDFASEKPEAVPFGEAAHTSYVTGLASTHAETLVSCSYDRHLIWWDLATEVVVRRVPAHDKWIRSVIASPDDRTLCSLGDDMVARLWDSESGSLQAELRGHKPQTPHHYPSMLFSAAFSPDGRFLATADKVGTILLWDVATHAIVQTLEAPTMYTWDPKARRHSIGGIRSLAFSPDGKTLAAGGMGQVGNIDHLGGKMRLRLFAWETGQTLAEIESSQVKGLAEQLAFAGDGSWLLAQGGDHKGAFLLVDTSSLETISEGSFPFHVHDFRLLPDDQTIQAVGHNGIALQSLAG